MRSQRIADNNNGLLDKAALQKTQDDIYIWLRTYVLAPARTAQLKNITAQLAQYNDTQQRQILNTPYNSTSYESVRNHPIFFNLIQHYVNEHKVEIAKVLLKKVENINTVDDKNNTLLHNIMWRADSEQGQEFALFLIDNKIDITIKNEDGKTALALAKEAHQAMQDRYTSEKDMNDRYLKEIISVLEANSKNLYSSFKWGTATALITGIIVGVLAGPIVGAIVGLAVFTCVSLGLKKLNQSITNTPKLVNASSTPSEGASTGTGLVDHRVTPNSNIPDHDSRNSNLM